jgi:glutaredoxin/glutathione-dependent peroxiredoxin
VPISGASGRPAPARDDWPARPARNEWEDEMPIQVGDRLPGVTLKRVGAEGFADVTTDELLKGKKVVLFGVFGAFTPPCSGQHLPGYVAKAAELEAKGIDEIACVSVNDPFVLGAWAKAHDAAGRITMLADGNAELTKAMDLVQDGSGLHCGTRSKRYAMLVNDGVVEKLQVEGVTSEVTVSSADQLIASL